MKYLVFAIGLAIGTPALGDGRADAEYIIQQSMTRTMFEGAITAQRPVLISAIQNDLRAQGITLPDPDRFFDIFIEEFIEEFTETMQQASLPLYLDTFSEEELHDIAAFYRSDSGQAMLRSTPDLMAEGAKLGEQAGMAAGMNASSRVADRLEAEGKNLYSDQSLMQRLIDALR